MQNLIAGTSGGICWPPITHMGAVSLLLSIQVQAQSPLLPPSSFHKQPSGHPENKDHLPTAPKGPELTQSNLSSVKQQVPTRAGQSHRSSRETKGAPASSTDPLHHQDKQHRAYCFNKDPLK